MALFGIHPSPRRLAESGDVPLVDLGEQVLRRRKKREDVVAAVQSTVQYHTAKQRHPDLDARQPNPADITISKRAWESAFRAWRRYVRSVAAEGA